MSSGCMTVLEHGVEDGQESGSPYSSWSLKKRELKMTKWQL